MPAPQRTPARQRLQQVPAGKRLQTSHWEDVGVLFHVMVFVCPRCPGQTCPEPEVLCGSVYQPADLGTQVAAFFFFFLPGTVDHLKAEPRNFAP